MSGLIIDNLSVTLGERTIVQEVSLTVPLGQVHAIMGPNGSGKSTLSYVLAGKPGYEVTAGSVHWQGQDLLACSPEQRAWAGFFLGFQYPVSIPGLSNLQFFKSMLNAQRKQQGLQAWDAMEILQRVQQAADTVGLPQSFLYRGVNEGFSGGEKKRNEMMQMLLLQPGCILLDELDSGLDIDALDTIARVVNGMRHDKRVIVMITHYPRLLERVVPDRVHVLHRGRLVRAGEVSLAHELEQKGYGWLEQADESAGSARV